MEKYIKILIILLVMLIIVAGGMFIYTQILNSNKTSLQKSIDDKISQAKATG
jgi:NADH:ubiquinone oxidoreductase subunit 3 (subunit A)